MLSIKNVLCENLCNPLAIDTKTPRFSWQLESDNNNIFQESYRIIVRHGSETVWDSETIADKRTYGIGYGGKELESRGEYNYDIFIRDNYGDEAVSTCNHFETEFFDKSCWSAAFIEPDKLSSLDENPYDTAQAAWTDFITKMMRGEQTEYLDIDKLLESLPSQPYHPPVQLRRKFALGGGIQKARLYITAHGIYDARINGRPVSDVLLAPEFTSYDKMLKYQIYDVTNLLGEGENAVGVTVADGWYKGKIATGKGNDYGDNPALLLQLEITYSDGTCFKVCSDDKFLFSYSGPYIYADLFKGEKYDARLESGDFSISGFNDSGWKPVHIVNHSFDRLTAQTSPPIRAMKPLSAVEILTTPKGETIVDLGQNIAGHLRVEMHGEPGDEVVFEHGEVLDKDGNFFYAYSGTTREQKDIYILKGGGTEIYEPKFTYHGFRYVRVTGGLNWTKEQFKGIPISSDNKIIASFSCSDERLNKLQSCIIQSQRSNLIGTPTDCPTREKAGWTGDVVIYAKTALFNQSLQAFFESWLKQIRGEQRADGQVLNTVPIIRSYMHMHHAGSIGWGDVIVTLPWDLYTVCGDKKVLSENYDAMNKWMAYLEQAAAQLPPEAADLSGRKLENQHYLINTGFHFGDWLVPSIINEQGNADGPKSSYLTKDFISTSLYAFTTDLMNKIAVILGDNKKAEDYKALNERIRLAFDEEYCDQDGRLKNHIQGNYILALQMNMVPDKKRKLLISHLAELIEENGFRLDAGFMSVPFILDVLSDNGRKDLAYRLLFQNQCPSWLYEIEHGATTMWEEWGAVRPDGSLSGCSFNHYAFGCVGDWIYRNVLGIQNNGIAYENIIIKPGFDSGLRHAKGSYESIHGAIKVEWSAENGQRQLILKVPPNVRATILLGEKQEIVGSGKYSFII